MRKATSFIFVTCTSFTVLSLVYSILALAGIVYPITPALIIQFFLIMLLIALAHILLQHLIVTNRIGTLLSNALQVIIILLLVIGFGGFVFHWFPFTCSIIFLVVAMVVFVYIIVYLVSAVNARNEAHQINQAILEKKRKSLEESENTNG